jgi:hypothetical protein
MTLFLVLIIVAFSQVSVADERRYQRRHAASVRMARVGQTPAPQPPAAPQSPAAPTVTLAALATLGALGAMAFALDVSGGRWRESPARKPPAPQPLSSHLSQLPVAPLPPAAPAAPASIAEQLLLPEVSSESSS